MSQCPNTADVFVTATKPAYGSEADTAKTMAGPDAVAEAAAGRAMDEADAVEHDDAVKAVHDAIGADAPGGIPADSKTRTEASRIARRLTKDDALKYAQDNVDRIGDNFDQLDNSTSVNRVGWYFKMQTWLAKRLKTHDAEFHLWSHAKHGQNDRSIADNDFVRLSNQARPAIRGLMEKFSQELKPYRQLAEGIAKRIGKDTDEVMRDIGNYALWRHTPEANAALLAKRQRELAAEQAKGEDADPKKVENLMDEIESIETYLDETDLDGVDEKVLTATGYTNGQAAMEMQALIDYQGFTKEELEAGADMLCSFYNNRYNDSVRAGVIPPEMAAAVDANNFQYYVPATTRVENNSGSINDIHPFNPGSYHARDGRTQPADDAFTALNHYARRAANAIGMQPFAERMMAAAILNQQRIGTPLDSGLRMRSLRQLTSARWRASDDPYRSQLQQYNQGGGLVVNKPVINKDGMIEYRRFVIAFDPKWSDAQSGLNGVELNKALVAPAKAAEMLNRTALATSAYGQMFTRFRPYFAIANMSRDSFERAGHLSSRDYFREDGTVISGTKLLPRFAANIARATKMLMQVKLGKLDPSNPVARMYDEYVKMGLHPEYTFARSGERMTDIDKNLAGPNAFQKALNTPQGKFLKDVAKQMGDKGSVLLNLLDNWNDYFNNVAPFAQYMTLKEAGVATDRASQAVLDSMNMSQTGTAVPVLRALFPFVKPTIQSAAAFGRMMGMTYDPRGFMKSGMKGWGFALGSYFALSSLKDVIRDQMGQDEEGNWRLDGLSLGQLSSFIPVGTGDPDGSYFKLQTGFGLNQLVSALVWGQDRMERGLMSGDEFASHMLFTAVKNLSPGNWPEFSAKDDIASFIVQAFSPTIAKPVLELAVNKNYFGSPIKRGEAPEFTAKANYGSRGAGKIYHELAQSIYKTTGIDLYPEQVQHLAQNLFVGPFRVIRAAFENDTVARNQTQHYKDTHLDPILEALGGSLFTGYTADTGRTLYFRARDYYENRVKEAGVKMSAKDYGEYGDRATFQRAQLQNSGRFSEQEIDDIINIYEMEQQRAKGAPEMNARLRNTVLSASELEEVRVAFEELAKNANAEYSSLIDKLNYYRNAQ